MAGQWSILHERVIAGAIAMQAKAMSELQESYGPPESQEVTYAWQDFMRQADECGHQWGTDDCTCQLCADIGRWMTGAMQQMQQQTKQTGQA